MKSKRIEGHYDFLFVSTSMHLSYDGPGSLASFINHSPSPVQLLKQMFDFVQL